MRKRETTFFFFAKRREGKMQKTVETRKKEDGLSKNIDVQGVVDWLCGTILDSALVN